MGWNMEMVVDDPFWGASTVVLHREYVLSHSIQWETYMTVCFIEDESQL